MWKADHGMRVGSMVYDTDQGLGILAKDFYDHGIVTDPVVVVHGRRPSHPEWFPEAPHITDVRDHNQIRLATNHLLGCDAVLFFETPFIWELFRELRGVVRTFLMPMHECMPRYMRFKPDWFINPSLLDQKCYPERSAFVPVPVPDSVKWRRRTRAEVFVHNAGHGGLMGRNGTRDVLEATRLVKSDARFLIRCQTGGPVSQIAPTNKNVEIRVANPSYDSLWRDGGEGDVFLFPERFNGLSLPLQEAHAAGMLVVATDRFPMNTWLPNSPLIPPKEVRLSQAGGHLRSFEEAVVSPESIAEAVDWWYGRDVTAYSEIGRKWGEAHRWDVLGLHYVELLREGVRTCE